VIAHLADRWGRGARRGRFHGEIVEASVDGELVQLLCPLTMMNRSGRSVLAIRDFFKILPEEILVVCDDFHLPLGRLRCRPKGSAGGQKGLNDIIRCLGTDQVPRFRMGIGPPPEQWDVADYVLSRFRSDEQEVIEPAIGRAGQAVIDWIQQGMAFCMNRYNGAENNGAGT